MLVRVKAEDVLLVRDVDAEGHPTNVGSYIYGSQHSAHALPKRDVTFRQINQDVVVNVYVTNEVAKKLDAMQSVTLTGDEVSIVAKALWSLYPDREESPKDIISGYINYKRNKRNDD